MKKEKRILHVLGQVDETYIAEAAPGNKTNHKPGFMRWVSAAAVLVILVAVVRPVMQKDQELFTPSPEEVPPVTVQTVPSETAQEPERVIPPATIKANGLHLVQLVYAAEDTLEFTTDFIIHINPNTYIGREENGTYMIRPATPVSGELPECSLQVARIADVPPAVAAESIRKQLTEGFLHVGEIGESHVPDGIVLHADNGNTWNAEQVDITITDDLLGGSYVLTSRYFTEATEGHGVRFADMIGTFRAVTSHDTAAMPEYLTGLNRTISAFSTAFFSDRTAERADLLAEHALIATYDMDVTDEVGIASVDYSISGDDNPTGAVVSVKHRINTEDSYNYLTIELTYLADGGRWLVQFAGVEK